MGRMAKLLTEKELNEGEVQEKPMIIERTILLRVPEGKKIDPDEVNLVSFM